MNAPTVNERSLALMIGRLIRAVQSGNIERIKKACAQAQDLVVRLGILSPLK